MGASGWHHFVPWDPDVDAALQRLRAQVFATGRYHRSLVGRLRRPRSIEEARAQAGEGGTHSVLDVDRVIDRPLPAGVLEWTTARTAAGDPPGPNETRRYLLDEAARSGTVAPVDPQRLREVFGDRPRTRTAVEHGVLALMTGLPRNTAVWLEVTDEHGTPLELCFAGVSGD